MPDFSIAMPIHGIDSISKAFISAGKTADKWIGGKTVKAFDKAANSSRKLSGGLMKSVIGGNIIANVIQDSIRGIFSITDASIKAFQDSEAGLANVRSGIESTGGAAGRTLAQLTTQAETLAHNTFFEDDTIMQNVTAQILTFSAITGKVFDRTQAAVLDVSAKLHGIKASGSDLHGVSIQLGKALENPVNGLAALARSGITFTDSQKETVKAMMDVGNLAGAQNLILSEIEAKYGGTAKALAATSGGVELALKNTIGDIQELYGAAAAPVKLEMMTALRNVLIDMTPFLKNLPGYIDKFVEVFKMLMPVIPYVVSWFILYNAALKASVALMALGKFFQFVKIIMIMTKAKGALTAAQWALNFAMNANPIGLMITAFVALGAVILTIIKYWDNITAAIGKAIEMFSIFTGMGSNEEIRQKAKLQIEQQQKAPIAPNQREAEARAQTMNLQGNIDITTQPGTTATTKLRGAPGVNMRPAGQN